MWRVLTLLFPARKARVCLGSSLLWPLSSFQVQLDHMSVNLLIFNLRLKLYMQWPLDFMPLLIRGRGLLSLWTFSISGHSIDSLTKGESGGADRAIMAE
jgi:glucose-6-phosphate-specific signal transduction histidine kinase